MKMELIQPFINAADAVLAQGLQNPVSIGNLSMEEEAYRRKGVAALVMVSGDIEGRMIFDLDPTTALRVASRFAGAELPESDDLVRETVCELSCTSMVFHGMLAYTPALASLAPECKGCPGTFCKGCHETEHRGCKGGTVPRKGW